MNVTTDLNIYLFSLFLIREPFSMQSTPDIFKALQLRNFIFKKQLEIAYRPELFCAYGSFEGLKATKHLKRQIVQLRTLNSVLGKSGKTCPFLELLCYSVIEFNPFPISLRLAPVSSCFVFFLVLLSFESV